jgi:hypothetical protein
MKRAIPLIIILLLLGLSFWAYRSYRTSADTENAARISGADQSDEARRAAEDKKKAIAEAEAHRLAALLAEQKALDQSNELARLRADEAAAEARRLAAEREAKAAAEAQSGYAAEKDKLTGEARRLAAEREAAAAAAAAARLNALKELEAAHQQKKEEADRLATTQAATQAQIEKEKKLETEARQVAELLNRAIYPPDYKRREHYYLDVNRKNAAEQGKTNTSPAPANK